MTRPVAFMIGVMFLANAWLFLNAWQAFKERNIPETFDCFFSGVACYSAIFFYPMFGISAIIGAVLLMVLTRGLAMVLTKKYKKAP
ncbi:hypothetical protein ACEOHC_003852 [Salmonella enterica]